MRRMLSLCLLTLALATVSLLFAAPLPQPRGTPPAPVENDGFALELVHEGGALGDLHPHDPMHGLKLRVNVRNQSKITRDCPLEYAWVPDPADLKQRGESLWERNLCYVIWYPDNRAVEFRLHKLERNQHPWLADYPPVLPTGGRLSNHPSKAPRIAPAKVATGRLPSSHTASVHAWDTEAAANLGPKFCLTVVCGRLGLQSNTISIGGCPFPPAGYRPLDISEDTPRGKARREAIESERWRKHKQKLAEWEEEERRTNPNFGKSLMFGNAH